MALRNLNELFNSARSYIQNHEDINNESSISDQFVSEYVSMLGDGEQFQRGSFVSIQKSENYTRFIPHQWFKLANSCSDFRNALIQYKEVFNSIFSSLNSKQREDVAKELKGSPEKFEKYEEEIKRELSEQSDLENFKLFLCDYSWFSGGKTVDRGDFWFTPVLNLAGLVHADGSTFGEICTKFATNKRLKELLHTSSEVNKIDGIEISGDIRSVVKQVLEQIKKDFGFESIRSTLSSTDQVNYKTTAIPMVLFKVFDREQSKEELTSSNTLRWFEDVFHTEDSSYWYLTTQWTNNGGERRDFSKFLTYIEENFPSVKLKEIESGKYLYKKEALDEGASIIGKNLIVYGAPGTGKSYYLQSLYKDSIRTVFHSDYSNADFIGSIRPSMNHQDGQSKVVYDFIPGPFALAIRDAVNNPSSGRALLIEEINRGDAANIFGEIFQLLDRRPNGESEYEITVSLPFTEWLLENCPNSLAEGKLRLPSNLSIIATMNSADQGVQAMDSAFKRRWRFLYMPVRFEGASISNVKISYRKQAINWKDFAGGINKVLEKDVVVPEDRLIGPYFLREDELESKDSISEKLLLYLWDDVLRISGREVVFADGLTSFFEVQERYKNGQDVFSSNVHESMGLVELNV